MLWQATAELEKNCPSHRNALRSLCVTATAIFDEHNYVLGKYKGFPGFMRNLEVLSLLTQVNRKLDCGDTTSFPETKKKKKGGVVVIQYNPVYRNQAKPKSSQNPRNRGTLLTSNTQYCCSQCAATWCFLEPRKVKVLGHGHFPVLPLSQAALQKLSATGVSTNEQRRCRIVWGCTVAFTFTTPRAIHLQSCSLSFSPRSATSHQNSHSCPEPLGQYFPPDFSMLLFPRLCILQCYDRFLLGSNCPWCENYPLRPLLIYPLFCGFWFTLMQKYVLVDNSPLNIRY